MAARHAAWALLLIPACFHPNYDHPRCGPNGECPSGLSCNAQSVCDTADNQQGDAGIDTPNVPADAQVCFGTGLLHICLAVAPIAPLRIVSMTQIDTDSSLCAAVTSGGNYCVLAATTISIEATLRATGTRPLVLLASNSITTSGLIDVGSHRGALPEMGAGADPATCAAGTAPGASGGGAGGSFAGIGGNGGAGGSGGVGGTSGNLVAVTELRGGCAGQDGNGPAKGSKGHGGGAVFLIAGNMINVGGGINAAGEGGAGGGSSSSGAGGGGAGGMIGFDSPTIVVSSLILANGGGGGEGSGSTVNTGSNGSDPFTTNAASGGGGNSASGGDGGNGSAGPATGSGANGLNGAVSPIGGGGGGGGGAGLINAPATATLGTQVSPAATP